MTPREIIDYSLAIMFGLSMIGTGIAVCVAFYDMIIGDRERFKDLYK